MSVLLGLGVVLGMVSMIVPWWTVDMGANESEASMAVKPFDTGASPGMEAVAEQFVSSTGVISVGVLALVGIIAAVGGGVLWLSSVSKREETPPPAWWLMIAGGVLFIMAPIVAAATWPAGALGFWDAITSGGSTLASAASAGWYMGLVSGALMATAGIVGIQPPGTEDTRAPEDPPRPEEVGAVAEATEEAQPPEVM